MFIYSSKGDCKICRKMVYYLCRCIPRQGRGCVLWAFCSILSSPSQQVWSGTISANGLMAGWTGGKAWPSAKIPRWEEGTLSRGIFALWDAAKSVLLNAFAVLVYPNDHTLSSCCGIIFADLIHENRLRNLSKNGILLLPSCIPDGERGC